MTNKPKTPEGTFSAPPPGAPVETAQPLSAEATQAMLRAAQANEQPLPPFNPQPTGPVAPPVVAEVVPAPVIVAPAPQLVQQKSRPAESNTDSPSRGIPKPITDPGKTITGGFGNLGEAQYYGIDGNELRELVRALMGEISERIENDLRFSMAIVYPRLIVRARIEVEGYAADAGFQIERIKADERTPIEVAREKADEFCFVISTQRREFDENGEPENPPDRLRDELGLPKPRKQFVQSGAHRMIVDVPADIAESF